MNTTDYTQWVLVFCQATEERRGISRNLLGTADENEVASSSRSNGEGIPAVDQGMSANRISQVLGVADQKAKCHITFCLCLSFPRCMSSVPALRRAWKMLYRIQSEGRYILPVCFWRSTVISRELRHRGLHPLGGGTSISSAVLLTSRATCFNKLAILVALSGGERRTKGVTPEIATVCIFKKSGACVDTSATHSRGRRSPIFWLGSP